jgi:hypothetical protein
MQIDQQNERRKVAKSTKMDTYGEANPSDDASVVEPSPLARANGASELRRESQLTRRLVVLYSYRAVRGIPVRYSGSGLV